MKEESRHEIQVLKREMITKHSSPRRSMSSLSPPTTRERHAIVDGDRSDLHGAIPDWAVARPAGQVRSHWACLTTRNVPSTSLKLPQGKMQYTMLRPICWDYSKPFLPLDVHLLAADMNMSAITLYRSVLGCSPGLVYILKPFMWVRLPLPHHRYPCTKQLPFSASNHCLVSCIDC